MRLKITFGEKASSTFCIGAYETPDLAGATRAVGQSVEDRENLHGLRAPFRGVSLIEEDGVQILELEVSDTAMHCMRQNEQSLPNRIDIILSDELCELGSSPLAGKEWAVNVSPA